MSVYSEAGLLIIGSRLKRLSDRFLSEVSRVYKHQHINFEPVWFPVFFLLDRKGSLSLTEIAQEVDVSHSAISQLITQLVKKKLVVMRQETADGRVKKIELTEKGQKLLQQIHPVWEALQKSLELLFPKDIQEKGMLEIVTALEQKLADNYVSETTLTFLHPENPVYEIGVPDASLRATLLSMMNKDLVPVDSQELSILAATDRDRSLGFLAYRLQEGSVRIDHLYVDKNARRKGIASALLARCAEVYKPVTFALPVADMEVIRILVKNDYAFKVK